MKALFVAAFFLTMISLHAQEPVVVADISKAEITFAPGDDCENAIVAHIDAAKERCWVQMYNFTSIAIAAAMIRAEKRGVDVRFLGDRSVKTEKNSKLSALFDAGIPCFLDGKHPIAHNKVVIIDKDITGTGSFNWSEHAKKNAENFIFLTSAALAQFYEANWTAHQEHAVKYEE